MKNKKVHLLKNSNASCSTDIKKGVYNYLPFELFYKLPKEQQCKLCVKTKYYQEQEQKMESERKASDEELGIKPKTQLELDTIKYNLSAEHVEILSKVDYEVVEVEESNGCDNCIFKGTGICSGIKCARGQRGGKIDIIFKQIHKTQESLNESIEKAEVGEGIEEPFDTETNRENNHSEHYEPEAENLEDIEKMELIACHGLPKEYHELAKENLNLALGVKYFGRLGKKDDTEKEISKMKNYNHRSVTEKWR